MKMTCEKWLCSLMITLVCTCNVLAANEPGSGQQVEAIKAQALELNRDLLLLKEEILYPHDSRLTVFLSLDVEEFSSLETVELRIDGRRVIFHQYTQQELDALRQGGVHRLYMGKVNAGEYEVVAVYTGKGAEGRNFRGVRKLTLEKTSGEKTLELEIVEPIDQQQPELFFVHSKAQAAGSLRYGTTLFYYFQRDYFNALTELMMARQLDEAEAYADTAELLRSGASLSYGMERAAEKIFTSLLTERGVSIDRDRAWFYLGKLAWKRADLNSAYAALEKMSPTYQGQLTPEANYLRASISLRRGEELLAASYETLLPTDSPWLYYHYYNLAASHADRGEWGEAIGYFQRVVASPLSAPEIKSLRDKALTASGYAYLAIEIYDQASADFSRVRLDSPLVDRALLGYGWAYSEMGDYHSAISPWRALAERSLMSDSVREGQLALAYAYEKLGRRRDALEQYRRAGEVYKAEIATVQTAKSVLNDSELPPLLDVAGDYNQDWLREQDVLPQFVQQPYLRQLISRQHIQYALRELRDLHNMTRYLSRVVLELEQLSDQDQAQQPSYAPRIRDLFKRAHSQQLQVQTSLQLAQGHVRELAISELQQQADKLHRALGQSLLAVARLYDSGSSKVQP